MHYCLFSLIFRVDFCAFRFSVLGQFNLLLRVFVSSWFVMLSSSLQLLCSALLCSGHQSALFLVTRKLESGMEKAKKCYQKKIRCQVYKEICFFGWGKMWQKSLYFEQISQNSPYSDNEILEVTRAKRDPKFCCMNSGSFIFLWDDHQSTNLTKLKTKKPWLGIGSKEQQQQQQQV